MSTSEHLLVYVSLILGIAVSRNLMGLAYLLVYKDRITFDWLFLSWGIFFVLVPAADWWDLLHWPPYDQVFIWDYFWLLVRPMVLFLICALLFTGLTDQHEINLHAHFQRVRPGLFTLGTIYTLLAVPGEVGYEWLRLPREPPGLTYSDLIDIVLSVVIAALLAGGIFIHRRAYHVFLFPSVIVLFVGLFALGE